MAFPEFEPGKRKILFFSRGRGRGHAIPDYEIIRSLAVLREDVEVRVVSYGTGAATFAELGVPHVDLKLPETGPIVELSVLAGKLIGWLNPDLVVSHEEFAAIPAAKIFDKPTLMLTDWFTEPEMYSMGSLKFADRILFLGSEGVFVEPPWVAGKVRYLGAVLREFQYGSGDKLRARRDLGLPDEATVISVFPGSWREADAPVLDLVLAAMDALDAPDKRLIWVAGADYESIRARAPGALVIASSQEIDRFMAATDVAITKTNRKTVFELRYLQVPTVAISFALNPSDDQAVAALPSVVRLDGTTLDHALLAAKIQALLFEPPELGPAPLSCRVSECAVLLSEALDRAISVPAGG